MWWPHKQAHASRPPVEPAPAACRHARHYLAAALRAQNDAVLTLHVSVLPRLVSPAAVCRTMWFTIWSARWWCTSSSEAGAHRGGEEGRSATHGMNVPLACQPERGRMLDTTFPIALLRVLLARTRGHCLHTPFRPPPGCLASTAALSTADCHGCVQHLAQLAKSKHVLYEKCRFHLWSSLVVTVPVAMGARSPGLRCSLAGRAPPRLLCPAGVPWDSRSESFYASKGLTDRQANN